MEDLFYDSVIRIPYRPRMHPDVEAFIIEESEKLHRHADLQISIQITKERLLNSNEIIALIRQHFENKREKANHQVKTILRLGVRSLFIAFLFLIIMFLLTNALMAFLQQNALVITLRELFIILGWVALWRPAELLLFEWRSHKRNAKLFDRIAQCKILFVQ